MAFLIPLVLMKKCVFTTCHRGISHQFFAAVDVLAPAGSREPVRDQSVVYTNSPKLRETRVNMSNCDYMHEVA